jgi:hypothetical protein
MFRRIKKILNRGVKTRLDQVAKSFVKLAESRSIIKLRWIHYLRNKLHIPTDLTKQIVLIRS